MRKFNLISNTNKALSIFWLVAISLSIIGIAFAAAPNPGHNFTEVSGSVAQGDIMYGSAVDVLSALTKNTTATRYLSNTGASNNPAWAQIGLTDGVTGILPTANGGTGIAYFIAAGPTVARTYTFPDANATVLTGNTAVTVAQGGTGLAAITANNLIYGNGTGNALLLAPGGTTGAVLMNTAAGAPSWSLLSALPSTAGVLPVANGGTGLATLTTGNVILGAGTSNVTFVTPGTSGDVLTSNGSTWAGAAPEVRTVYNQSVTTPAAGFAADTYLVGSSVAIPATGLRAGSRYHLVFDVAKTAAGTATPILTIRFGTAGSVADTSRCAMTWTAGTAAADEGWFEVWATFRTVGSGTSAVIQCMGLVSHRLTTTGLINAGANARIKTTGGGFDSTVASSIIGTSVNGGTSAAWTITLVQAELTNLP